MYISFFILEMKKKRRKYIEIQAYIKFFFIVGSKIHYTLLNFLVSDTCRWPIGHGSLNNRDIIVIQKLPILGIRVVLTRLVDLHAFVLIFVSSVSFALYSLSPLLTSSICPSRGLILP